MIKVTLDLPYCQFKNVGKTTYAGRDDRWEGNRTYAKLECMIPTGWGQLAVRIDNFSESDLEQLSAVALPYNVTVSGQFQDGYNSNNSSVFIVEQIAIEDTYGSVNQAKAIMADMAKTNGNGKSQPKVDSK